MSSTRDILRLFDRPKEPVYFVKGTQNAVFNVPPNFIEDRFKPIANSIKVELSNRFGEKADEQIPVADIPPPNLGLALSLTRYENFSLFNPRHRKAAGALINIFMGAPSADALKSYAVYARDRTNPYLFNYALSVAILHRDDTRTLDIPTFITTFPDKFMDGTVLHKAREEANIVPSGNRLPIVIPRDHTASDLDPEHRIAYWREDLGINNHHWHWHLVYPFDGPANVVGKDRRGEIFYFMHQQIQARYNFERLCNKLARVERFQDFRAPIPGSYFPKLDTLVANRAYPARIANMTLSDLKRNTDQAVVDIADLERWRDRIFEAIHTGAIRMPDGSTQPLDEFGGIDVLGNIMESSSLTPNRNYYGDLHNMLHFFMGLIHDPDGRHLETFGAVGDPATSMRDPLFFRMHEFVDDVFQEFKQTLPPYTAPQLNYQGITITSVEITTPSSAANTFQTFWQQSDVEVSRGLDWTPRGAVFVRFTHLQHAPFTYNITVNNQSNAQRMGTCRIFLSPKFDERGTSWLLRDQRLMFVELDRFTVSPTTPSSPANTFQTFWQQSDVEVSRGLDWTPRGAVFVRFTHLQHAPFTYNITVNNQSNAQRMGTCRIFLSPKFDERGTSWLLRDQRLMFVELDRFTVSLKQGQNVIQRRSTESTLTIPYERTFRDLDTNRPAPGTDEELEFNFCGCGWPQHVLIPKGDPSGFKCDLFVMISNYDDDRIDQPAPTGRCSDAFSFCGIKDRLYPDRRPMGYPFDRLPRQGVDTIQQFLYPNMRLQDVSIKFTERVVVGNNPQG